MSRLNLISSTLESHHSHSYLDSSDYTILSMIDYLGHNLTTCTTNPPHHIKKPHPIVDHHSITIIIIIWIEFWRSF